MTPQWQCRDWISIISFRSFEVDFVAEGGFRLTDTGFHKFWWISWISIFRSTPRISLSGEVLEEIESFVYLGSIFTSDGNCTQDIRKRLAMGRSAMQSLSSVCTRKPSSRWQTHAMLAKGLHGLRNSSGVVSSIARLPIDSLPMVSYYVLYSNCVCKMRRFGDTRLLKLP